ncbi:MAG: sensor histidine kinase, partial [Shimia sp.]
VLLAEDEITPNLEDELLQNAGVFNVVLRRDEVRQLVLASPVIQPVFATYDLRNDTAWDLIRDAITVLIDTENRVIRVIGNPTRQAGLLIEITMETDDLRAAMLDYGVRILILSAVISIMTAGLLFIAVRRLLVIPIQGVVDNMRRYARDPEDGRNVIEPGAGVVELRQAETALNGLQTQLTGLLKQKDRLAALGSAVAKVNHDLRNILTSAQLFADRMEASEDPTVRRLAPKLVASITRAVNLCEATLTFGRAEEAPPKLGRVQLATIVHDVVEGERLASGDQEIDYAEDIPAGLVVRADPEQLYRILQNLLRNARQAIEATKKPGTIGVEASEDDTAWTIRVVDTGPGLPLKAQEYLFTPFQGGIRKGGAGLGLAIAEELVRGHGGELTLEGTGEDGTTFAINLPKAEAALTPTADFEVAKPGGRPYLPPSRAGSSVG